MTTTSERDLKGVLDAYRMDRRGFIENFFAILPMDTSRGYVPFTFNRVQDHYWRNRVQHMIIAKARKVTASSIIQADMTSAAIINPNYNALLILQKPIDTTLIHHEPRIDGFIRSVQKRLGGFPVLTTDTKQHKVFDWGESEHGAKIESSITIVGSGSQDVVQGGGFDYIHATELPSYEPEEVDSLVRGILGSPLAAVRFESRPERAGDLFHEMYVGAKNGDSSYSPVFYPWFWVDEYSVPSGPTLWANADPALQYDGFPLNPDDLAMMHTYDLTWAQMRFWLRALQDSRGDRQMRLSQYAVDDVSCWYTAGSPVMPLDTLDDALVQARPPLPEFKYRDHSVYGDRLRVWRLPQPGHGYAIYADPAEGLEESHDTAIVCRRVSDWAHCFTLAGKFSPEDTGRIMMVLGKWYNYALLGWERDPRSAGIRAIVVGHYPNIYKYRSHKVENADGLPGLPMNRGTKEPWILAMRDFMESGDWTTDDKILLGQYFQLQSLGDHKYNTGLLDIAMADIGCLQIRDQAESRTRIDNMKRPESLLPVYLR